MKSALRQVKTITTDGLYLILDEFRRCMELNWLEVCSDEV